MKLAEKLIGSGKTIISTVEIDLPCKSFFMLARYAPHLEGSQFSNLIAECKEILIGMMKMLESKAIEVVEDSEPELEVNDKAEPGLGLEVVAKLVSLQEEIFSQPTKVIKLPIETLVDLPIELSMNLVPTVLSMRTLFFLRSLDVYDPLQILIQEPLSQEIHKLVYKLDFNGAELTCHAACILLELHR